MVITANSKIYVWILIYDTSVCKRPHWIVAFHHTYISVAGEGKIVGKVGAVCIVIFPIFLMNARVLKNSRRVDRCGISGKLYHVVC